MPQSVTGLQAEINAICKRDNVDRCTALRAWRNENPTEFERMRTSPPLTPVHKVVEPPAAVRQFERITREIAARDRCSRTEAMVRARQEHPREWKAAFAA